MVGLEEPLRDLSILVLLAGFAIAAVLDWRTREVSDHLWQALAAVGVVVGGIALDSAGGLGLLLWGLVGAFVFEHLLPWDVPVEKVNASLPAYLETGAYLGVGAAVFATAFFRGIGPGGLPPIALAVFLTVLIGRGLFELGLLYGGADAKGFIAAGVVLPIQGTAVFSLSGTAAAILQIYPFSLTMLMNAALVAIAVPIALGILNLRRGEFRFPQGFLGFSVPVRELPFRFVWVKDPANAPAEEEAESTEDDRLLRERQRAALEAKGISRVWVTPQLPFLVLMAAGAFLAIAAGNLLIDLLSLI